MNNEIWWVLLVTFILSTSISAFISIRLLSTKPKIIKILFAGLLFWVFMFLQIGIYAVVFR